jgi:hypothetical protein
MRYLLFLIFLLSPSFVFAQVCPTGFGEAFYCKGVAIQNAWLSSPSPNRFYTWGSCPFAEVKTLCYSDNYQCPLPTSKQFNPDGTHYCDCPDGESVKNVDGVQKCVADEPPPTCPDGASPVYDPSTNQMVCPTTENGSSSSTSSFCLVPGS